MLELTELQELASPLVESAALLEIRLFESHGLHVSFPENPDDVESSEIDIVVECGGGESTGMFVVRAQVEMQEGGGDEGAATLARFTVAFGALYAFDSPIGQENGEALDAFGRCVASLALWPYVRAETSHLAAQMNFNAPLTLPMLTQRDLVEMSR